jgi:hypothetical protein
MMLAWWVAIFRVALANRAGGGFDMIKGENFGWKVGTSGGLLRRDGQVH